MEYRESTPPELCPCKTGSVGLADPATGSANSHKTTGDPIQYADGSVQYVTTDLSSDGFGKHWGQTRSWTNYNQNAPFTRQGNGWNVSQHPSLLIGGGGDAIGVAGTGTEQHWFHYNAGSGQYVSPYHTGETLTPGASSGELVYTDTSGDRLTFYGPSASASLRGQFKSFTDAGGNVTSVTARTSAGNATVVQRSETVNGLVTSERYAYTYAAHGNTFTAYASGDPNGELLTQVELQRQVGGGSWTTVRKVEYAYYDGTGGNGGLTPGGTQAHGSQGDLQTATIKDGSGNVIDELYYRSYTPGQANGYAHGLKYVFGAPAFARLQAAVTCPLSAADSLVAA